MHDRDIRDVRWILHVDASHDDVSEGAAEVFQRPLLITASANSLVPTADGSSRSALRSYVTSLPSATTDAMASSSRSPAARSPMCLSMRTPASINAIGFTLFWPAYLGALPWIASNIATPFSPMFAPGATPRPPTSPATRSLTMSPYRFGATSTAYRSGFPSTGIHEWRTFGSSN